ncbi:methyl-accepting chemotaxis protein [Desulfotomaculum sp. 1211_IL3151]|uniref:methyl-accepting chemotaxis protein n=1 Tax=Desulfotomaculum sp. 1211_IL3151 TaxID=3084055 RepID=UPI002FD9991E
MNWYNNLSIKTKLLSGFMLVAIIAGAVGFIGIKKIQEIDARDTLLYEKMTVPISHLSNIATAFQRIRVNTRDIIIAQETKEIQNYQDEITRLREEIDKEGEAFKKLIVSQEMMAAYEEFIRDRNNYSVQLGKLYELAKENKDEEAFTLLNGEAREAADAERDAINKLIQMKVQDAKETADSNTVIADTTLKQMTAAIIVGVGLAIFLGIFISRGIVKPTSVLQRELHALAEKGGDLTQEININSKDEIGDLARTVNKFIANLRSIMLEVNKNSVSVAATAQQLNSSSEQTTAGANETAATMSEISTTVEQVSDNIQVISSASGAASDNANEGNRRVLRLTEQMQSISNSSQGVSNVIHDLSTKSQEIGQIVELITTIADQTNLLALNAAIEAARAGEQGRGFAVVAEEVRRLAEQSGDAAKQIKDLIHAIQYESSNAVITMDASTKDVQEGMQVVQEVGESFKQIISAVQGLTIQIQDVASATEQMSAGVQNVAASTEEQTAAMEEVSASAESLSTLAVGLNELVNKFKI